MPPRPRARLALLVVLLATLMLGAGATTEALTKRPSAPTLTRHQRIERVISIAKHQIGDPWVWGRQGPAAFDCIGLVNYAFRKAHALHLMGGASMSIPSVWADFRRHHRASRSNPHRGDLVIWGGGKHIGIYLGRGKAISALTSGVRIHGVHQLTDPLTVYLHLPR
ncbi:MAG: NlpC/P60 family protein [Chloroflexota bacterium]